MALRFKIGGKMLADRADAQPDAGPGAGKKRKAAAEALAKTFKENLRPLHADHQHARQGQGDLRPLARLRTMSRTSRHLANRVEPEVVDALVSSVREAYPRLSHRYYALKAKWFGKKRAAALGPQRAAAARSRRAASAGRTRRTRCSTAYGAVLARRWPRSPSASSPTAGSTRRRGRGKSPGAFAHPTVPSAHPYVLLNYQGKPRDVMTLAHELGHGVHQVLAAPNGALMAPTPLTLAETASVFGEMLTFMKLLAETTEQAAQG